MSIVAAVVATATQAAAVPSGEASALKDLAPLGGALVGIVALIVSAIMTAKTLRVSLLNTEAGIWQKANELEINEIQEKLDGFYGPFTQMSATNAMLSRDLRHRQIDSDTFLLLEKLFDRDWLKSLPEGERALVDEVVANAITLRNFINENAKMVDLKVQPYLSRVCAHYRILELAHQGKLGSDSKMFVDKYVFPIQVVSILNLEMARLEKRKRLLRSLPSQKPPLIEELVIPESLKLKDLPYPKRVQRDGLTMPISDSSTPGPTPTGPN
jgi:hypothetical protein